MRTVEHEQVASAELGWPTLVVAWSRGRRVSRNRGSRTAGIDGKARRHVEQIGVARFLRELRGELKSGEFRPLPVRERLIPKRDGKMRRLGIPTLKDRVVQMALKLVMEPLFEADFYPPATATGPVAGRRTRSPRLSTSRRPPRITSGSWRPTSRRASIVSRTPSSWRKHAATATTDCPESARVLHGGSCKPSIIPPLAYPPTRRAHFVRRGDQVSLVYQMSGQCRERGQGSSSHPP
jgi:hypothetical protein